MTASHNFSLGRFATAPGDVPILTSWNPRGSAECRPWGRRTLLVSSVLLFFLALPPVLGWQVEEEDLPPEFCLRAKVTLRTTGQVNWYLNFDPSHLNGYRVSLGPEQTAIAISEAGLERDLALGDGLRPGSHDLILWRDELSIRLYLDGVRRLRVDNDFFHGGILGVEAMPPADCDDLRLQPLGDLFYSDDFMRTAEEEDDWNPVSGDWRVNTLHNPILSHNAFSYVGRAQPGRPALSVTGRWFWKDYSARVAVKGDGTGAVGLCVYYHNPANIP